MDECRQPTPEFLLWSIERACPVRGLEDGRLPERTERQLRAARAVGDAQREGRVFDGLCLDPPDGFRIDEALTVYGGLAATKAACQDCTANALAMQRLAGSSGNVPLAGCYGFVALPSDEQLGHEAVERAIERARLAEAVEQQFPPTRPRWYGLWMASPLSSQQSRLIQNIAAAVRSDDVAFAAAMEELCLGLQAARAAALPVHGRLYPKGMVEGVWWRLVSHCGRCGAPWPVERSGKCQTCNFSGRPAPARKRRARGNRPYFPLARLLGAAAAEALLTRYWAAKGSLKRNFPPGPETWQ